MPSVACLISLVLAASVAASSLRPPSLSSSLTRLRGGEDAADQAAAEVAAAAGQAQVTEPAVLSREEILKKMNGIPTFCIVNKDGNPIAMIDGSGDRSICWLTDAQEARAILHALRDTNPDAGLQLVCHGLGSAFEQCNGFRSEENSKGAPRRASSSDGQTVDLRLKGNYQLCKVTAPHLEGLLKGDGFDPGCWTLPVFLCNQLGLPSFMPIFFHPRDLATIWEKSGRKLDDLTNAMSIIDLRMLVHQMETAVKPWSTYHFVGSKDSSELADEITKGGEIGPPRVEVDASEDAEDGMTAAEGENEEELENEHVEEDEDVVV